MFFNHGESLVPAHLQVFHAEVVQTSPAYGPEPTSVDGKCMEQRQTEEYSLE